MTFVYFAEHPKRGIKIGCSGNPIARARNLSASLLKCIRGDRKTERSLHHKFAELRIDGEWFRDCPRLRNYAKRLTPCRVMIPTRDVYIRLDKSVRERIQKQADKEERSWSFIAARILEQGSSA